MKEYKIVARSNINKERIMRLFDMFNVELHYSKKNVYFVYATDEGYAKLSSRPEFDSIKELIEIEAVALDNTKEETTFIEMPLVLEEPVKVVETTIKENVAKTIPVTTEEKFGETLINETTKSADTKFDSKEYIRQLKSRRKK